MFLVGRVFCFRSKSLQFLTVKNEYISGALALNVIINSFMKTEGRVFLKKDRVQKSYHYSNVSADSDIQKLVQIKMLKYRSPGCQESPPVLAAALSPAQWRGQVVPSTTGLSKFWSGLSHVLLCSISKCIWHPQLCETGTRTLSCQNNRTGHWVLIL